MTPKDTIIRGPRTVRTSSWNNPAGTTTLEYGIRRHDKVVQKSVRGNYLAPTSYSCETMEFDFPHGSNSILTTWPGTSYWAKTEQDGYVTFDDRVFWDPPKVDNEVYNTALNRLNAKIRGELDLTLALSQAGSTAGMLHATKRAERYVDSVPTSRWRAINNRVSSAWLEFTYGWKPLAQDIYQAAAESQNIALGLTNFDGYAKSHLDNVGPIGFDFQFFGRAQAQVEASHKQLANIRINMLNDDPVFERFASINPAAVTWENVPYSFVVDWVYDLSSYLRAVDTAFAYSCRFQNGFTILSFINEGTYKVDARRVEPGFETRIFDVKASGKFKQTYHARLLLGSYPLPRLPTFNTEISAPRLLNLAALLASKIKRVVPK